MTILLVNDDGYEAVGIKALESVLSRYGHEIWVSAPKTQMSGMSHAMTIGRPMKISRFGENHYFMDGTPVDCILYAKRYEEGLFPHDPDLVISGINNGYNLATDITYSGTCGAAREAVLCSWKAIAVSSEGYDAYKAAEFLASNLERLYSTLDLQSFLNINFPPSFSGAARLTIPGEVRYLDKVILSEKRGDMRMSLERTFMWMDTSTTWRPAMKAMPLSLRSPSSTTATLQDFTGSKRSSDEVGGYMPQVRPLLP